MYLEWNSTMKLYGFLQVRAIDEDNNNYYEDEFDKWLNSKEISKNEPYKRLMKDKNIKNEIKILPTLIRNVIHHMENSNNSYTTGQLRISIEKLINVIKSVCINYGST